MVAPIRDAGRRQVFAERFALLYAEAGAPPLKRIVQSVARTNRRDEDGRPVRLSVQRLSDWRLGHNVPAKFSALEIVLTILIELAGKSHRTPAVEGLYELDSWRLLWQEAAQPPARTAERPSAGETARAADTQVCPYRGLAAFRCEDAAFFLGRAASTEGLIARLNETLDEGVIVVLVGASGAGKSSLLRAGLIPAIASGGLTSDGSASWPVVIITPREDPLEELANQVPEVREILDEPGGPGPAPADLRRAVGAYAGRHGHPGARLILVVDQFEEIFTLCGDERARAEFIGSLSAMCATGQTGGDAPALVVLGVRADFYDRCLDYPDLAEALQRRQLVLGPMNKSELCDAVTGPARAVGLRLEPGLVEVVLQDAGIRPNRSRGRGGHGAYDAGVLPLLSHALRATWQRRRANQLTVAGYRATGGIHGSVQATAERAWAQLDRQGQAAALRLLLRLTHLGEDTQDTRRRANKRQLLEETDDRGAAERALEVLVNARLVTLDGEQAQITHEALFQAWPRLHGWTDQRRTALILGQRVEDDANEWERQHRDASLLYRGTRLEAAQQWARAAGPDRPSEAALALLAASTRNRAWRTWAGRAAVAIVAVLALVAGVIAVIAGHQRDAALFAQVLAQADQLRDRDPSLSAQLDLVAHRMKPDDPTVVGRILSTQNAPLARPLHGSVGAIYDTAFTPDGRLMATASEAHSVQLWNLADPRDPVPLGPALPAGASWVSAARFSPDGRLLASSNGDGTVHLWRLTDAAAPTPLPPLRSGDGEISQLTFSPDGRTLATANDNGTVRLWNVSDPVHPGLGPALTGFTQAAHSVAFSPDGHLLAAGSEDTTAALWDVTDPTRPVSLAPPLTGHSDTVQSIAFAPDSRTMATGSVDKTARLWDVADPRRPSLIGRPRIAHGGRIWTVAFSPDGNTLATGSADGTAKLWNVASRDHPAQFGGDLAANSGGVTSLSFSPDGRSLATGGQNGTTLLWSLPRTVLLGHTAQVRAAAFDPASRLLATGSYDSTMRLWDLRNAANPSPLGVIRGGPASSAEDLAFQPNGPLLAAAGSDGAVRLWNAHLQPPIQVGQPVPGHSHYSHVVAFDPSGTLLATAATDDAAQLWDVSNPATPLPLGAPLPVRQGYISSLTFSPDGHTLAVTTANSDGDVSLWNVADPTRPAILGPALQPHAGQILQAAFSPNGRILVAGGGDGAVRRWDVSDPAHPQVLQSLAGNAQSLYAVAFGSDGRTLGAAGVDRVLRLWSVDDELRPVPGPVPISGPTGIIGSVVFVSGPRNVATASDDDTVMLWDLDLNSSIERVCATTRGTLTPERWRESIQGLPYSPPCATAAARAGG